jgi:uncharacterized lipoprotein YmbA
MMRRLMSVTAMALTLAACASEEPRPCCFQ